MQTFTFEIRFRFDSAEYYETSFDLALSDEETTFVKAWLKENGDMPFWAFEFENEPLFGRFMDFFVAAIISYVNQHVVKPGEDPFNEDTVSWDYVQAEFGWPNGLLNP